jgi:uncharacterized protein (UPF0548 family)
MFLLRFPGADRLNALWLDARSSAPSYEEVGATSGSDMPAGYRHDRHTVDLGRGADCFDNAVAALRGWHMHTRSGLRMFPEGQILAPDQTVLGVVRAGPLTTVAPCRVVSIVDEVDRFGFAYGTLPGHPEQGEEAFVVTKAEDGVVQFTITAFSRPRELLARMGGPVTRLVQKRATAAYIDAMKQLARGEVG